MRQSYKFFSSDYYPFGMVMAERSYSSPAYRYGFNGQEKDDEVAGNENINTAQFWEYDCRLGRRWNLDPFVKPNGSNYSGLLNNPLINIDPLGNTDYFSNKGRYLGTDGVDNGKKVMALDRKTSQEIKKDIKHKRNDALANIAGIIPVPSSSEVGAMHAAWQRTVSGVSEDKKTGHEEGFVSGGGNITVSKSGADATLPEKAKLPEIDVAALQQYQIDRKVELIVHTHPDVELNTNEGLLTSGSDPSGSVGGDDGDFYHANILQELYGSNVLFAVIGIDKTRNPNDNSVMHSEPKVTFFNGKGVIGKIKLRTLQRSAKRIEKHYSQRKS
jgi:RHS repeat-associated protein